MRAGGDIEKHHLVRALLIVLQSELNRITHIAQLALFGLAELDAASHLTVMNVQARNDAFCNHADIESIWKSGSKQVNQRYQGEK
jgi:hypothetical protein